jgi:oxalate decarboxylase/phosphoglucose isomerase-like protein (cupin superfamily)
MSRKGIMLAPLQGQRIQGGGVDATVKVAMAAPAFASSFEVKVPPGYDVGAHVHSEGEEIFYVVRGHLDVLAFEPMDRSVKDWHEWRSADGTTYLRGGPGSFLYVPPNCPHAFSNPTSEETLMFFQSSVPGGHEHYFEELAELLVRSQGRPRPEEIVELRGRYGIEQLTPLGAGHAHK